MMLSSGIAQIPKMLGQGITVGLGSDMAAYYNVSPFEQMRLACMIQNIAHKDSSKGSGPIKAGQAFGMATRMGAKALGMKDCGAIAKGKKADIALLSSRHLAFTPLNDLISQIVYSAYPCAVHETIVDGKVLMREGEVLACDAAKVIEKGKEILGPGKR